jgi:hypothetical protein
LQATGDTYWAQQADAMLKAAQAWEMQRRGDSANAVARLREAAEEEDGLDKRPVTPGPIVPAREQLGELLLALHRAPEALIDFKSALALAPGRRGALTGAMEAAEEAGDTGSAGQFRQQLAALQEH